ncbi:hypothetical protein M0805_000287 [Coniferiporia weirii]|nr:hypothetical protein M0805_000287 [Coniferiporia weirii]
MSSTKSAPLSTQPQAASTTGAVLAGQPNQPIAPAAGGGSGSGGGPARLRTQGGRKKAAPSIEPDAIYRAEPVPAHPVAGAKRTAQDRPDAEPRKRKRVDHAAAFHVQQGAPAASANTNAASTAHPHMKQQIGTSAPGRTGLDGENQPSLFEFTTLPTSALYRYIIHHDLAPAIYPTPLTSDDPPPPAALLDPARMASRAPSPAPTPANRPRRARESKESSRRRSTRLLEEEIRTGPEQTPVLADVGELHGVLAVIAQRHFRESSVREVDTLASFVSAVKARGGRWQ